MNLASAQISSYFSINLARYVSLSLIQVFNLQNRPVEKRKKRKPLRVAPSLSLHKVVYRFVFLARTYPFSFLRFLYINAPSRVTG